MKFIQIFACLSGENRTPYLRINREGIFSRDITKDLSEEAKALNTVLGENGPYLEILDNVLKVGMEIAKKHPNAKLQ